jgi:hypothetical protein
LAQLAEPICGGKTPFPRLPEDAEELSRRAGGRRGSCSAAARESRTRGTSDRPVTTKLAVEVLAA